MPYWLYRAPDTYDDRAVGSVRFLLYPAAQYTNLSSTYGQWFWKVPAN